MRKLNPSRQAGVRIGGLVTVVGAGWKALSLLGDVIELPGKLQPLSDAILAHPGVFPWVLVLVGVASIAAGYYWPRKGPTEGGPPYQPHHVSQTHSGAGHNIVAGSISFENSDRDLAQSRFAQFRDELLQGTKGKTYTIEHSMSDAEAEAFARQIAIFLDSNGFDKIMFSTYMGGGIPKGQSVFQNFVRVGRR